MVSTIIKLGYAIAIQGGIMEEIFKSKDYEKFVFLPFNRAKINNNLVARLEDSMSKCNMLNSSPIIVSDSMEIIDGQHRFLAAKNLGLPIYYVFSNANPMEALPLLNSIQEKWKTEDFLNLFCSQNNEHYHRFKKFCDSYHLKYNIGLKVLNLLMFDEKKESDYNFKKAPNSQVFRTGNFEYPEDDKLIKDVMDQVRDIQTYIFQISVSKASFIKTTKFILAIIKVITSPRFRMEKFREKLALKRHVLKPSTTTWGYEQTLKEIFNYRNPYKID